MTFAQTLNLMPVPQKMTLQEGRFSLDGTFAVHINGNPHDRIYGAATRFLRRLDGRTGLFFKQGYLTSENSLHAAPLTITIERPGRVLPDMEESYQLKITDAEIILKAITDLGAMHGLETLLQLLNADAEGYFFPAVDMSDAPRFAWRGLMVDGARHFIPLEVIRRNLDAMAAVKLNVFHLHLTEDQGWRFESKKFPKLTELGSDGLFYTQQELRDLVAYADARGIRVVPEIDVPGHSTALLVGYPELGSAPGPYEIERRAGIMDPTLDPTLEATYEFLEALFKEVMEIFPDPYFHIGGDENNGNQWNANPGIQAFIKDNDLKDNHGLQTYFNQRLLPMLTDNGKRMMGWDEIFQPGLPKDAVIHSWQGPKALAKAAREGYQAVLSNGYYIDLSFPTDSHYLNDPLPSGHELSEEEAARILGGEATMWSELVTPLTIDSRIWPRTAAIAERLWSPGNIKDVKDMYRRLEPVSLQLEELGIQHNSAREVIMRNLCRTHNTDPLRVLLDVTEPMKEYTRNPEGELYFMYSPFTLFADACRPDAKPARDFRNAVDDYLINPREGAREELLSQMDMWSKNHARLLLIIKNSPVLKEIESLSASLSRIADLGMMALNNQKVDPEKAKSDLEAARQQGGRCELMIVEAIGKLL